jgi:predicted Zn-dependent peptidase
MYNNLPPKRGSGSSSDITNKTLSAYNDIPVQLDQNVLTAMIGLLESRGFSSDSSESIATTILIQAKRDDYNPMTVLETMKTIDTNSLNQIISEILNYNRFKTSVLGTVQQTTPVDNVKRNIVI